MKKETQIVQDYADVSLLNRCWTYFGISLLKHVVVTHENCCCKVVSLSCNPACISKQNCFFSFKMLIPGLSTIVLFIGHTVVLYRFL